MSSRQRYDHPSRRCRRILYSRLRKLSKSSLIEIVVDVYGALGRYGGKRGETRGSDFIDYVSMSFAEWGVSPDDVEKETSMADLYQQLLDHLRACEGMVAVRPVTVTVGKASHVAAWYRQERNFEGKPYMTECFYLLAPVTVFGKTEGRRRAYTYGGEDWYVAGYTDPEKPPSPEHNPLGHTTMLRPWRVPSGEPIDHYEPRPYKRAPMQVVWEDGLPPAERPPLPRKKEPAPAIERMREIGGRWAAYENQAMDSSRLGDQKFIRYDEGTSKAAWMAERGLQEPPAQLPDTPQEINWPYRYAGDVDLPTGQIVRGGVVVGSVS